MVERILIEIYRKRPDPMRTVIVDGGLAYWNGVKWISNTGSSYGRPLDWEPKWWTPLLTDERVEYSPMQEGES
jgi:hypothetical protein